jgi:hypothetical protein
MSSFWRAFYGQVEYAMRCRELRTLFGFKLPADLAQAFIAARGSAGAQDAFHEVRSADAGSTGSLSSLRVCALVR